MEFYHFSSQHLYGAKVLAREFAANGTLAADVVRASALATSSVILAVAFAEALINEIFELHTPPNYHGISTARLEDLKLFLAQNPDCEEHPKYYLPLEMGNQLASVWTDDVRKRASILCKYQLALDTVGAQKFDKGTAPYQDAALAIRLRDSLVHAKSTWMEAAENNAIEAKLGSVFPNLKLRTLQKDHADWVIGTMTRFTGEFLRRLGIVGFYQHATFLQG